VNGYGVDEPNFNGGALGLNRNPRNGRPLFNPGAFSLPPLGQAGNAGRRSFYGPGLANFDLALSKRVWGGEASGVLFRLEAFNAFNHAQFFGAGAVNGEILSASFGRVVNCMPPRLVQLALKYAF
jgi:hypothetical protein